MAVDIALGDKYKAYPEYKNSGVDSTPEMPSHWVAGKVKYVTDSLNKTRVPLSSEERGSRKGKYPYYGASGIIDHVDDYLFDEETILFGEDGANLIARSSPLAFLAKGKYWVNNHAHILRTKDGINNFWVQCFENIDVTPVVSGSAQPKLTAEALGDLQVVYPPTASERKQIANFLDHETVKIDTLIEKQQQLIKLLKEKRQAVISHAVTRGLPSTTGIDVPMRDSGVEWLGEVPAHWEVKRLRFLGTCQNGINIGAEKFGSGYPFVSYGDAYKNETLPKLGSGLVQSSSQDREVYSVLTGDVIFTRTSETIDEIGLSSTCLVDIKNATFAGFLIRFRPDTNVLAPNFSKYYFRNILMRTFFIKEMNLVTRASLSQDLLKKLPVTLPPFEEQEMIGKFLDHKSTVLSKLTENALKAIELMQERRTALISAAVTGKIDVRDWCAPQASTAGVATNTDEQKATTSTVI